MSKRKAAQSDWSAQKHIAFYGDIPSVRTLLQDSNSYIVGGSWTDLASFAFQLVTGFDLPFLGSNNNDKDFADLNARLDVLTKGLDDVSKNVQDILIRLKQLPYVIKGIIHEELLTQWLSSQQTHVQLLRPYLKNKEMFGDPKNYTLIGQLLNDLAVDVNEVVAFSAGKMAGFSASCSAFSVWVQGMTMRHNVSGGTIWDEGVFDTYAQMVHDLFDAADLATKTYAIDFPNLPGSKFAGNWNVQGGSFHSYNYTSEYEPNIFTVSTDFFGKTKKFCSSVKAAPGPTPLPKLHYYKECVEPFSGFENPSVVKAATNLWKSSALPYLNDILAFRIAFQDYTSIRDKVFAAMKKPP